MFHHCLSITIASPCSEGALLTGCPSWSCCCHFSITSVSSRRCLISLLSLSSTPHVRECVAWAAACTACPNDPRPTLTKPSALACSLEMRLLRSLRESTFSWASEALPLQVVMFFATLAELRRRSPHGLHVDCSNIFSFCSKNRFIRFAFTLSASQVCS